MYAASYNRVQIVEMLVKAGSDLTLTDNVFLCFIIISIIIFLFVFFLPFSFVYAFIYVFYWREVRMMQMLNQFVFHEPHDYINLYI